MGCWFESNILQRISVLYMAGWHRWMCRGLKIPRDSLDTSPSHQLLRSSTLCTRCMVTYDVILPGWFRCGITDGNLGFYAIHKPTKKSIQILLAGWEAEWESLSIYFWNIWNKKLYLWEVFYTSRKVAFLSHSLYNMARYPSGQRGPPAKGLGG